MFDFNDSLGSYLWSLIVSKLQARFSNFKTELALQRHIKKILIPLFFHEINIRGVVSMGALGAIAHSAFEKYRIDT